MPSNLSFPKARRLTRVAEFDRVRQHGKVWRGSVMTLAVATAAKADDAARLGIIASRKVGKAALRNRSRRRVREIFRKRQWELKSGIWIVVILSSRAAHATYRELEDEWLRLAGRASILTP